MKHRILLAVGALLLSVSGMAWADKKPYIKINFRDDDPFVFCTQGIKDQDRSWKPLDPISGTYIPFLPYCPTAIPPGSTCPENVYPYVIFEPWTQNSWDAYLQYVVVCKFPHRQGDWTRRNGQGNPEDTPYSH